MNKAAILENDLDILFGYMRRWLRVYRIRRGFSWVLQSVLFSLAMCLGLGFILVINGKILRQELLGIWGILILLSITLSWLASLVWPIPLPQAARLFDQLFGLKERLSTAFEFAEKPDPEEPGADLILRQRADSIAEAAKIDPHRYLPVHINRGQLLIIFLLLVGNSLIIWRGEAQFQTALREHQFQQAVEQEINQIEEIRDSIASDETLTSVQGQELLQPLDDAIQALSQAGSREQAISILTEAKTRLEALANPSEQQLSDNLSQLGEGLSQQEGTPLEAFGQQLSNGKLPEASQELERLDLSQLSADQAQALAAQLEESAQALESSHPPLADALAQASESLRSGEIVSASEALRQASEELRQTAGQNAQNQVARSAVNKIAAAEERLIAAGQSVSDQSSTRTGELSSTSVEEAMANGEGSSQASGSSSQTGGESSGSGAGRGEGDGDSIPGSEVGSSPISQDNQPGDSGLQPYEMIYSPQRLGGDAGELLSLPEGSFAGDQVMGQGLTSPGENTPPRVPYVDVYQHYAEIYRQALQSGAVPPAFRALVRKYFSSLEP